MYDGSYHHKRKLKCIMVDTLFIFNRSISPLLNYLYSFHVYVFHHSTFGLLKVQFSFAPSSGGGRISIKGFKCRMRKKELSKGSNAGSKKIKLKTCRGLKLKTMRPFAWSFAPPLPLNQVFSLCQGGSI